jgi:hypothetical protein
VRLLPAQTVAFDDQHPAMHGQASVTVEHRASWVVERAFDKPHPTRGLYLRQHCRAATNLMAGYT